MVLSFYDGPDPRYTPDILATLRAHRVRAMFFVCGEMARATPTCCARWPTTGTVVVTTPGPTR
ncbi:hypothetical protein SBADM41S_07918 [Streptomyces badius]